MKATSANGRDAEAGGGIELIEPPPDSKPGDRIYFEGERFKGK